MKYLKQFTIILFVSFLGELLHLVIPLPIPASVYGLVLMLLALCFGILHLEQVKAAADFLIEIMGEFTARHVYSRRGGAAGFMECATAHLYPCCTDYDSDYHNCHGRDRSGHTVYDSADAAQKKQKGATK